MARPRKYATNAEKQAAYRSRKGAMDQLCEIAVAVKPIKTSAKSECLAFVPRGTKCKLCGKSHA